MSTVDLPRLVALVESKLDALPDTSAPATLDQAVEQRRAAHLVLKMLRDDEGASLSQPGDTIVIRLGGITASSTMGASQVLRNWLTAARKRLASAAEAR